MSTRHTTITSPSTAAATPMPARAPALSGALVGVGAVTVEKLAPTLDEVGGPMYNIYRHMTHGHSLKIVYFLGTQQQTYLTLACNSSIQRVVNAVVDSHS